MGRYLLSCALFLSAFGCSGPDTPPTAKGEKPVAAPTPSVDVADGPGLKDLPKAIDLPLYPGASLVSSKIGVVAGQPDMKRYHVTLETIDPVKKVIDFYSAHGIKGDSHQAKDQSMGATPHGNLVIIDSQASGGKTTIKIKVSPAGDASK